MTHDTQQDLTERMLRYSTFYKLKLLLFIKPTLRIIVVVIEVGKVLDVVAFSLFKLQCGSGILYALNWSGDAGQRTVGRV